MYRSIEGHRDDGHDVFEPASKVCEFDDTVFESGLDFQAVVANSGTNPPTPKNQSGRGKPRALWHSLCATETTSAADAY